MKTARLKLTIPLVIVFILIGAVLVINSNRPLAQTPPVFSGESAYQFVVDQVNFGPRTPGSTAHQLTREYIEDKLLAYGWKVEVQDVEFQEHGVINIIARRGTKGTITLLGAHYDTRLYATEETDQQLISTPVPGANDGASGVAVLLELARTLPQLENQEVWLVFFDVEDQGRIEGWDWIIGSRAFVQNMATKPDRVVILDMIGDANLQIYREEGSDASLTSEIWSTASRLGYVDTFINEVKYNILDDHVPFTEAGIPAVDIIDIEYPYWHTLQDTADKISAQSLEMIGMTITTWLQANP